MQAAARMVRIPTGFPLSRIAVSLVVSILCALTLMTEMAHGQQVAMANVDAATALRTRFAALHEKLERSALQPGLYLESFEESRTLRGDIYAVVDYPFATVGHAFADPASWCEALILHLNIKNCQVRLNGDRPALLVAIGQKNERSLNDTHSVEFDFLVTKSAADYMLVDLTARKGPFGTKDYHIAMEIVAIEAKRAFTHVRFSYTNGVVSNLATEVYLGSKGKDKVGFTVIEADRNRDRDFIGGLRGAVERNTMRYFLAIDAYLHSLAMPPQRRFEESAQRWFAATERYSRQLHEVDRDAYLTMKRSEYWRQRSPQ